MSLVPIDIGLAIGLILAWVVLSFTLAFRLLDFPDLSVEGSLPLGAAVFAALVSDGAATGPAVATGVLAGAAAGATTALLHARLGIDKFLAAVLVVAICYSLSLRVMGTSNLGLLDHETILSRVDAADRAAGGPFRLRTLGLLAAILACGSAVVFAACRSRAGLSVQVAGTNPAHARSLGLPVAPLLVAGLAATNAMAAGCGVLLAMYQGFVDVGMGQGTLVLAIAGMAIGERLTPVRFLSFRAHAFAAAVLGSLVYQILAGYALHLDLSPTDLKLATAVFVLAVVALGRWRPGRSPSDR